VKATEANLLKFLKQLPQLVIPIYQRNYSWAEDQCRQLPGWLNDWRPLFAMVIGVRHVA
jgi:hypothetical protein